MVGARSRLHARDAEPVEPRRAVLPGRARPQGDHRLLGRHLPELHAEPDASRGAYRARRGRGRALVVPRVLAAARGRGAGPARRRRRVRSPARRWRRTTRSRASTRRSARSGCSRRSPPTSRCCTRRSPTARATSPSTRRCSKACGARSRRGAARSSPSSGSSTTCGRGRTSCASRPTGCSRSCEAPMGAHPGGLFAGDLPVDGYGEDYDFWVDARAATPRRRLRRRGSATGCSRSTTRTEYLDRLGDEPRSRSSGPRPSPTRGRSTRRAYPPDLDAPVEPLGARRVVGRAPPRRPGRSRSTRDAVLAGAGVANLAAWLGVAPGAGAGERRAAHGRDRAVGLRPDARRSVRAQPPQLPARRRCSATRRWCSGTLVGGPGTTTIALPRRRADRPARQRELDADPRRPVPRRVGRRQRRRAACAEASSSRRSRRSGRRRECGYITSPGRAVRALVTDLGTFEKLDGPTSSCSPRCPRARAARRSHRGRTGRVRLGPAGRAEVRELAPPTADEVAALRRWDPRGWFLRAR